MRRSVSSSHETLRRELKIRRGDSGVFWRTSRCFIWWWNTVSNAWYYFSKKKMILEGEIKDAKKWAVFHLISKNSLNIIFFCIFFMNYWWVWEILTKSWRLVIKCQWNALWLLPPSSVQLCVSLKFPAPVRVYPATDILYKVYGSRFVISLYVFKSCFISMKFRTSGSFAFM